ncbi:MAG: riboflavin synthase [Planctomycetes bacterium]|nr:riboflavin synthase [Planctomycetota bacterium]
MFTGIIETVGTIRQVLPKGQQMQILVDINRIGEGTQLGDSIAVNGVCLTVCKRTGTEVAFDVSSETVTKSSLKTLRPGAKVNLERAMSANGRFGGHIVQGHVDGAARIASIKKQADFATFRFEAAADLLDQMVLKGSVAVDGVSVTVAKLDNTGFEVAVIPTTLQETTWQNANVGDVVNIETDILIKVVKKQLEKILPADRLTPDKLKEYGF